MEKGVYTRERTYRGESTRESLEEEAVDSCAKAWLGVWATVTEGEDTLVAVEGDEDGGCCCFFLEKKDIERKTELKVILYGCDGVREDVFIYFIKSQIIYLIFYTSPRWSGP